jgi:diguanylate cyclase (GGDEF)-like protein
VRNSLRWRIFALVAILLLAVEAASLFVLRGRMHEEAERGLLERLAAGRALIEEQTASRAAVLATHTATQAKDFALLEAFHLGGRNLAQLLDRRRGEVGAAVAIAIDARGRIRAATTPTLRQGTAFALDLATPADGPQMLEVAGEVVELHGAPLLAPERVGWIAFGFPVAPLAAQHGRSTALSVTLVATGADGARRRIASTLPVAARDAMDRALTDATATTSSLRLNDATWLGTEVALGRPPGLQVEALLQRSRDAALAGYDAWWQRVLEVYAVALAVALIGAWALARSIVQPIRQLADQAAAIEAGDFVEPITVEPGGELGELVDRFNHMQKALAERERSIRHHLHHDALTDLANRAHLESKVAAAIGTVGQDLQRVGVMLVGLGRFREINDTLGHEAGDQLLKRVADRLRHRVGSDDLVARVGGDEFGVLVKDPTARELQNRLERIAQAFDEPFTLEGMTLHLSAAIGLAIHPDHGRDATTLLRHADRAMWTAKQRRSRFVVFDGSADRYSLLRLGLLGELRNAIEHGDLVLHYQPKLDMARGELAGAEALVRWQHPVYGVIPPGEFIPMVESTGNISLVTSWALREARRQAVAWRNGTNLRVAVNVSAHDLRNAAFLDQVEQLAGSADAELLGMEITESAAVEDVTQAISAFHRFRELGIKLAIDDYGTGYSSMAQLKKLPVDELKIDQSFVLAVERNPDDEIIVRSTIELGHNMGLEVVGEGVESRAALEVLQRHGCDMAQGYFLSRPLPADRFEAWRASGAWRHAAGVGAAAHA